mmetsp:Transcript_24763/g.74411  ORF Transcript_24763/g.74411 Transcript_24763/m.74411 type:complete len:398 (-) Transcript_24763:1540-2733(-)
MLPRRLGGAAALGAAVTVAVLLFIVACGGNSRKDSAPRAVLPPSGDRLGQLEARLAHLEEKVRGQLNEIADTSAWALITGKCTEKVCAQEMGSMVAFHGHGHLRVEAQGQWEQCVCIDGTKFAPGRRGERSGCVAYDFGIREEAEFGVQFARAGCEVHAFDPSPTTQKYMKGPFRNQYKSVEGVLRDRYHFHTYGGGGTDGGVILYGYNWAQVTIQHPPKGALGEEEADLGLRAQVRKLSSIMDENGHSWVDILKIDVEGSEYHLLESAMDDFSDPARAAAISAASGRDLGPGCLPTDHLMLEWHHFGYDVRYNAPQFLNYFTEKMRKCGLKLFAMTLPWAPNHGKEGPYARQCFCRFCEALPQKNQFVAHGVHQTYIPDGQGHGDPPKWETWDPTK